MGLSCRNCWLTTFDVETEVIPLLRQVQALATVANDGPGVPKSFGLSQFTRDLLTASEVVTERDTVADAV
jgi:hypothetical protein